MAGRDMSANLGGMLTGTANALGTAGSAYAPSLVRNIENMSRPDADPTDIASQQALMQWQNNMGRVDEAAVTGSAIKQQQAQALLDVEADKEAKKTAAKAKIAQLSQSITQVVNNPQLSETESGRQAKESALASLQNAIIMEAQGAGLDATEYMDLVTEAKDAERNAYTQSLDIRAKEDALADKKERTAVSKMLSTLDLTDPKVQEAAKTSPLGAAHQEMVNDAINLSLSIDKQNKANLESMRDAEAPVDASALKVVASAFSPDSEEGQQVAAMLARVEEFNNGDSSAQIVTPAQRKQLMTDVENLTSAMKQPYALARTEDIANDRLYRKAVEKTLKPSKAMMDEARAQIEKDFGWITGLGKAASGGSLGEVAGTISGAPSEADVIQLARKLELDAVNKLFNKEEGHVPSDMDKSLFTGGYSHEASKREPQDGYSMGEVRGGYRYIGGPADEAESWEKIKE